MFNREIIDRKMEALQRSLDEENDAAEQPRWKLERHSVAECNRAIKFLDEVLDSTTGKPARSLTPSEQRWVTNETLISSVDFLYFATRYGRILPWYGGDYIPFELNIAQRIILSIWAELEGAGKSIILAILKARQLGATTLAQCALLWILIFRPNTEAVMGSSNPQKSGLMGEKFDRFYDNLPWWMKPERTQYKKGVSLKFGNQGCALSIEHGSQENGIGRGSTPTAGHLSEVSDYVNPEMLIDASLLRAMHPSPNLFLIMESQAGGRHSWWHKNWEQAKAGKGRFNAVFLPWFVGSDLYPTETWLKEKPVPARWQPSDITFRHAERAEQYVRSVPLLRKHLGAEWKMSREQQWFWEETREEYASKGELAQFYTELPADDVEAFQSLVGGVFSPEVITYCLDRVRPPVGVFGFAGPGIAPQFQPERRQVDQTKPPVQLKDGYQLIPIRWQADTDPQNKLFVYEWPKQGWEYGLGVDTGDGIGQDRSALQMVRKGDLMAHQDVQVAEYFSDQLGAADAAPLCYALMNFFPSIINGEPRQSKAVIECMRNGENTQHELRKMGWRNFHRWVRYDAKIINHANASRIGWYTNVWSRAMLMDYLIKAIKDDILCINSPWLVDEMADLERNPEQQSLKAAHGAHDDLIMSIGIVWFSLHIMELVGNIRTALNVRRKVEEEVAYARYTGDYQASDEKPPEGLIWVPPGDRYSPDEAEVMEGY